MKRKPKITDQTQAQLAYDLLKEFIVSHPEIESNIWISAMGTVTAEAYAMSNISYEKFCKDMDEMKRFYRKMFEEKEE